MDRDQLVRYLDEFLDAHNGGDYCPNGLQVEGKQQIRSVITGVSANLELIEIAVERGADAILVHHGIFWKGDPQPLVGYRHRRVAALLNHQINLISYHLPLDRHPELGNNALAADAFGLEDRRSFGVAGGLPVGFGGPLAQPCSPQELAEKAEAIFQQRPLSFLHGPDPVRSLALISGAAEDEISAAHEAGYDAFLTGEIKERIPALAQELGIHFLSCGHHATERLGIRALGEHLSARFDLEVDFVDVPNPV
ncbi:MAG: Nif3-like dinuclear metal center hexameric protein [Acidobacteriota bacterium]